MRKEINKAVEIFHRMAFGTKNNIMKIPESKLSAFISVLTDLLSARYEKNWYPENPDRGSGYRCIRVNSQSIDPTIVESLKRASIKVSRGLIVTELTIWVDPGIVSFRIGEDGSIGSEVVDIEVYNLSQQAKKRSGLESEDSLSSRSSSPGNSLSANSSRSTSPSASSSPVPSKYSATPSPPVMDYNPYNPRMSYPSIYQRPVTPRSLQMNSPIITNQPQQHDIGSQSRPMVSYGSSLMSVSNTNLFSQPTYIPSSQTQRTTYSRPQVVYSAQESMSGISHDEFGKMAFNPYHVMPMIYGNSLQQTHMYDIPVMA